MAEEKKSNQILMSWKFPEFIKPKRTKTWYIIASLIGISLFLWAVFTFNYLFALIILIIGSIILFERKKEPKDFDFKITERGLEVGSKLYLYKDIKFFWIIYDPPEVKNLYFNFKSGLHPRITIPLLDQDPLKVRKILLKSLEEDLSRKNEPFLEQLSRILKL